jgi:hypothetical protein
MRIIKIILKFLKAEAFKNILYFLNFQIFFWAIFETFK